MAAKLKPIEMKGWIGGMNSLLHPSMIREDQFAYGENVAVRGGIVQTRPGLHLIKSVPGTKLQGFHIFEPNNSRPQMIVAVDGRLYRMLAPYRELELLDGITFSSTVERIHICSAIQTTKLGPDGRIELQEPRRCIIAQDGISPPGYYDGIDAKHLDPNAVQPGPPVGSWMVWTNSRLWVAVGARLYASDLADPTHFTENDYLAERSAFDMPGEITGMIATSDRKGLLIFTADTTTAIQSNILKRETWQDTPDFMALILPEIGCESGYSPVNDKGITYWMSAQGFISLDVALNVQQSSEILTNDAPMARSKRQLSPDLSTVSTISFENYLMVSVPAGGRKNYHTWAFDNTSLGQNAAGGRAWCGVWSGAQPAYWGKAKVGKRRRCFFASLDDTAVDGSHIHIWEVFHASRKDDSSRVLCQFESRMMPFPSVVTPNFLDVHLCEMAGEVDVQVFIAGYKGPWIPISDKVHYSIPVTSMKKVGTELTKTSRIFGYRPQSRTLRSKEFDTRGLECSPEYHPKDENAGSSKGWAILVEWRGQCGVRAIDFNSSESDQPMQGICEPGDTNASPLLEDGTKA